MFAVQSGFQRQEKTWKAIRVKNPCAQDNGDCRATDTNMANRLRCGKGGRLMTTLSMSEAARLVGKR